MVCVDLPGKYPYRCRAQKGERPHVNFLKRLFRLQPPVGDIERSPEKSNEPHADLPNRDAPSGGATVTPKVDHLSEYWKCPKCGAAHKKSIGIGTVMAELGARVIGSVTCGNCGGIYSQSEVASGKYDTEHQDRVYHLRRVNEKLNFYVGDRAAQWGSGHSVAFNDEWSPVQLSWILDGNIFPVERSFAFSNLQAIMDGYRPHAERALQRAGKYDPDDAINMVIHKFFLSYAVGHGVSIREAQDAYTRVMNSR